MVAPFPSPTQTWHDTTYQALSPTRPELSAKGKTVVMTGGGASRIAILGRREQPLLDTKASIEQKFPDVEIFTGSTDVTKKSEVDAAFSTFVGSGRIDVMVSNAAMTGPMEPVAEADGDKWLSAIQQNLSVSLWVAKVFLHHAASDAVVIDVNSSAAHMNFGAGFSSYSAAKLGVFRLWDSVAIANPEMSIYHIQPGIVDTAMNKEAGGVEAVGFEDHVSLPASFNVWLASPEARFLKNKFLWSNWDVDELKSQAKEIESTPYLSIGLVGWPFGNANWGFQPVKEGKGWTK